jgi:hypothetical protein
MQDDADAFSNTLNLDKFEAAKSSLAQLQKKGVSS